MSYLLHLLFTEHFKVVSISLLQHSLFTGYTKWHLALVCSCLYPSTLCVKVISYLKLIDIKAKTLYRVFAVHCIAHLLFKDYFKVVSISPLQHLLFTGYTQSSLALNCSNSRLLFYLMWYKGNNCKAVLCALPYMPNGFASTTYRTLSLSLSPSLSCNVSLGSGIPPSCFTPLSNCHKLAGKLPNTLTKIEVETLKSKLKR